MGECKQLQLKKKTTKQEKYEWRSFRCNCLNLPGDLRIFLSTTMSLQLASLNSGSNGNCYYVGNGKEAVFIDAGISCKETERRMDRLKLDMSSVKAIIVTHEHSDHISGITALSRKYNLPVYATPGTYSGWSIPLEKEKIHSVTAPHQFRIGDLDIILFNKHHDASEPISVMVHGHGTNIGIFTDLGHACDNLIHHFKQCDAAILESNYCDTMLENGNYPPHLKKRIRSDKGHLSNDQALALFLKHRGPQLQYLLLGHLSQHNNTQEKVKQTFQPHAANTQISIASRHKESEVFHVKGNNKNGVLPKPLPALPPSQLKLF